MQPLTSVLLGLGSALAASAAVTAGAVALGRRAAAGPLALSAGFVAGYVALLGWPPLPPAEAKHRLLLLVIAAAGAGLVDAFAAVPERWRRAVHAGLFVSAAGLLLLPTIRTTWTGPESAAWVLALGAAGLLVWLGLERDATARGPDLLPLLVLGGTALTLALSGSAVLGLLAGLGAAAVVPPVVAERMWPDTSRGRGTVLAVLLGGLWVIGAVYTETPRSSLLLLAAVPPAATLLRRVPAPPLAGVLLRGAVAAALLLAAVRLALPPTGEADPAAEYAMPPMNVPPAAERPPEPLGPPLVPTAAADADDNPFARMMAPPGADGPK